MLAKKNMLYQNNMKIGGLGQVYTITKCVLPLSCK